MKFPQFTMPDGKDISIFTGFAIETKKNEGHIGKTLVIDFHRKINSGTTAVFTLVHDEVLTFHFNNRIILVGYIDSDETNHVVNLVKEALALDSDVNRVFFYLNTTYTCMFTGEEQGYSREEISVPADLLAFLGMNVSGTPLSPSHYSNRPDAVVNEIQTMDDLLAPVEVQHNKEVTSYNKNVLKLEYFEQVNEVFYRANETPFRYYITSTQQKANGGLTVKISHDKYHPDTVFDDANIIISTKDEAHSASFSMPDTEGLEELLTNPKNTLSFACVGVGMIKFDVNEIKVDVYTS